MGRRVSGRMRWERRVVMAVAAYALLAVAACGDDDASSATTSPAASPATATATAVEPATTAIAASGTRSVDTMRGSVAVPVDAERITVLDEYAGMNLLALGVVPAVVYGSYGSAVGQRALASAGAEIRATEGFSTPNLEDVAATSPDLILYSTEGGLADVYDELSAIAPTVELPYTVPFREAIGAVAEVVGREDAAADLIAVLDEQIAELHAEVGTDPMSISILGDTYGMVFAASLESPLARLIDEVGFTRPPAQANGTPDPTYTSAIMISPEVLGDHDADRVVVLQGAFYNAQTFLDAPTFQALPAVLDGRSVVADGDLWFGTFPFAVYWTLLDLAALRAGGGQAGIGDAGDVETRLAAFEELTR